MLVVDDHEVVRRGVAALVERTPDMRVCGQAGTRDEAVRLAEGQHPDVVLMDVRLGAETGIDAMREIRARRPETQVLILSSFGDDETVISALRSGAAGYVLKQVDGTALLDAVRSAAGGHSTLAPELTDLVVARLRRATPPAKDELLARLSPQEERVLGLIAQGLTNREIGDRLYIAEKTVKNHVSRILCKLEMSRRAEAAAHYTRHAARC